MPSKSTDVLIVGGGIIGLCIANSVIRKGLSVTILEKERVGSRASWAGAGMLNCRPFPKNFPDEINYHDLVLASIRLYEELQQLLLEETNIDSGFQRCGALEVVSSERATPAVLERLERILEGCEERGLPGKRLSTAEALKLEPNLDPKAISHTFHFPEDAQIRNPRFVKALALSCRLHGVVIREGVKVDRLDIEQGHVRGVISAEGVTFHAAQTVICMGAWTGTQQQLGNLAPRIRKIEPVKGQIVCYQAKPGYCRHLITAGDRYLVPRPDGILLAGSTSEQVGFDTTTTREGQEELKAFAASMLPELTGLEPLQGWADVRPGLKGPHPIMGPVPGVKDLFIAAGHFRNGICLAPITARILCAYLTGSETPLDASKWLPEGV